MKSIITIIAALAALPLNAQEQAPADRPQAIQCSCPRQQQSEESPGCPQAAMAAAFGFQRGYHMGFEAGFAEALHIIAQKAGGACKACGRPGKDCKHGRPDAPMPRQQPAPAQQQAEAPQQAA